MKPSRKHLTESDRIKIEALFNQKVSKTAIASEIGCHLSTVYRELSKGYYNRLGVDLKPEIGYSATIAQKAHDDNATAKGSSLKLGHDFKFSTFVEEKIQEGYSPAAVLALAKKQSDSFETKVCVTTLYNYIHKNYFLGITSKDLPRKNLKKRSYEKIKRSSFKRPLNRSIDERTDEMNNRSTFGHWEMDTVLGKAKGMNPVLLVLTERLTRQEIIKKIPSKSQESVRQALNSLELEYGESFSRIFLSITIDNGSEFLDPNKIEKSFLSDSNRTTVFYCHPFSSWERGSNENLNGMIRRKIPKGSDIKCYSEQDISNVEHWINHYPRKIHKYECADTLFQQYLKELNRNNGDISS